MLFRILALIALSLLSQLALAGREFTYEITITNITRGQTFTPQLLVTHNRHVRLYELGQPASDELEILAESGNTQPLADSLSSMGSRVGEVKTVAGLLNPGDSVVTTITTNPFKQPLISMAAMLIPTNDTFVAMNSIRLPFSRYGRSRSVFLRAYDAGTELNDQKCLNIPGPRCGGAGSSEPSDTDEGYIYVGNGFHDLGTEDDEGNEILGPMVYDWRNPVARVTIERIR